MKKIYSFMVAAVAMFAAAACVQDIENDVPETTGETVVYTAAAGANVEFSNNEGFGEYTADVANKTVQASFLLTMYFQRIS